MLISTTIMRVMISTSCHTEDKGKPIIISLRTASIYHLAGTILGKGLSTTGRFSSGNTIPDNIIMGNNSNMADISNAITWEDAKADINKPSERASIK